MTAIPGGGYRNDQMYGLQQIEGGEYGYFSPDGQYRLGGANNPPFIYPNRDIITQDANGVIQRKHLARGYIRSLVESANGISVPVHKCAFQFNPQYLQTSVAMATDVLNAFQQDIGQLSTPFAGNSNFQFSLMFDRSMELNNPGRDNGPVDPENTNIFSGPDALSPSQIGVFRDIGELNNVIGAGLSSDLVEFSQQLLKQQLEAGFKNTDGTDTSGYKTAQDRVGTFVGSVNFGNTAFLLPRPVRAVFSALFMVEGFVTNININYTKFTSSMVPMQATVELVMNAQYIGYAKQRTYVTQTLTQNALDYASHQQGLQADVNGLVGALQQSAGKVTVRSRASTDALTIPYVNSAGVRLQDFLSAQVGKSGVVDVWVPGAVASTDSSKLKKDDPVSAAIDGHSATFSGTVGVKIDGPFPTYPSLTGFASTTTGRNFGVFNGTGPTWSDFATKQVETSSNFKHEATFSFVTNPIPDSVISSGQYWIITTNLNMYASVDGAVVTGQGQSVFITNDITALDPFNSDVTMSWAAPVVAGQQAANTGTGTVTSMIPAAPTVPKSNNSGGYTTPGSTSGIGTSSKPIVINGKVYS